MKNKLLLQVTSEDRVLNAECKWAVGSLRYFRGLGGLATHEGVAGTTLVTSALQYLVWCNMALLHYKTILSTCITCIITHTTQLSIKLSDMVLLSPLLLRPPTVNLGGTALHCEGINGEFSNSLILIKTCSGLPFSLIYWRTGSAPYLRDSLLLPGILT